MKTKSFFGVFAGAGVMLLCGVAIGAEAEPAAALEAANEAFAALEFESVLAAAEQVLASDDATVDQRMDAYFLQGSALAVMGRGVDAETSFRYLLRGRPDFDVAENAPPKIVGVFRKVQAEERAIRTQVAELERRRVLESLALSGEPSDRPKGGVPIVFVYSVQDPTQSVSSVRVRYRRSTAGDFSSLALERGEGGQWHGQIPGEWTENDDGFELQYFTSTYDGAGSELISEGTAAAPHKLQVEAGTIAQAGPFYAQPWFWAVSAGALLAVGAAVGTVIVVATLPPASGLPVNRLD